MYTTPEDLTQGDVPSPRRRMPADRTRRHRPRHCAELAHDLASGGPEGRAVRPSSRSVRTVRRWVQDTGHRAADPAAMVPVRRAGHLGRPPSPAGGRDTSRSNRTRLEHRYAAGPLVGVVRAPSVRPTDLGIGELEWLLSPAARGGGYATEAARAARDDAFDRGGFRRLLSIIDPCDGRSRRVATKLGMHVGGRTPGLVGLPDEHAPARAATDVGRLIAVSIMEAIGATRGRHGCCRGASASLSGGRRPTGR